MRLRKKPWIKEAIDEYNEVLVIPGPGIVWDEAFGRTAPLHVELGTGKGRFITALAEKHPECNFIGLEAQLDVLYYAAQKAYTRKLTNLKLAHFDANRIMDIFAPGEVSRLYINFCDPWPKQRHAKRRLTHNCFLDKYRIILVREGELYFKTDNERLFEFSLNEFCGAGLLLRHISLDLHNSEYKENIMTEYESKFSSMGMKIYRTEATFNK
ncbi:MAG: tRNA ((7)-)-methyltransferase [Firmicutes bacterium]|nr:tRNA ((7)-)-methyltransferase [Bacillota bacterium]